ncbi:MAG: hypothetical protein ACK4WF_03640 [Candidatus Brocadiales bacterium]
MAVLVGIDEAGYGPTLGPLVITAVAFEVKDYAVDGNLWEILKGAVTVSRRDRGDRLAVADSKNLYTSTKSGRKLRLLEEGVLAFQGCVEHTENLKGLLDALHCYNESQLDLYPWYHNMQLNLPLSTPLEEVSRYRELLREVSSVQGVKFLGARAAVISPYEFNKGVASCGNKALLLFDNCAKLISNLWGEYPQLSILCDKHGGRNRYKVLLSRAFSGCKVNVLLEGPEVCSYELKDGKGRLKVSFMPRAEDKHLPVALASMYSKYLRELFLKLFNRYWHEKLPGLKSTAGYPEDARRFLCDISKTKASLGISDEILVRNR